MNKSITNSSLKKRLGGRNLYLVGMMGCGKTMTGPPLAKKLAYGFVDSDAVVEEAAGRKIHQIFEEEGEESFREIETKVLEAIGQRHSLVVATGGGVVTIPQNWGVLHQGIVVWIDPGRERILERLKSDSIKRPLMQSIRSDQEFDSLFNKRRKYYSQADLHIDSADNAPEQIAVDILSLIPSILIEAKN